MSAYKMANFIYKKSKEALFKGGIDITTKSFKTAFIKTTVYTPNQNTDEFLSTIPSSAIVYRSSTLSNLTNVLGTLDANDLTEVYDGQPFQAIVLYQVGTTDANSRLISFIDDSPGLPFSGTADATTLTLSWDNTATKIISL